MSPPPKPISTANAEHYTWGGTNGTDCDGWHLVRTPELSIIEELMPPDTSETRHHHIRARQFFYVLQGELVLDVEQDSFLLQAGEGIEHRSARKSSGNKPDYWFHAIYGHEPASDSRR